MKDMIYNFLVQNGASLFWTDAAIQRIMPALNTNQHFLKSASKPKAYMFNGRIKTFACEVELSFPDSNETRQGKITYSFRPSLKKAHQIKLDVREGKAVQS